jgi:hypothetical protein
MSEARLDRIERLLADLGAQVGDVAARMATKDELADVAARMATKDELADVAARMATKDELADVAARMATKDELGDVAARMATKDELAAAVGGVAKNVDLALITRQQQRMHDDIGGIKDDITVLTAIAQRLDHTMTRQIADLLTEVRAEHSRMDRLLHRMRALEEARDDA